MTWRRDHLRRMSRRDLFRYAGVGAGAAFLAACDVGGRTPDSRPTGSPSPAATLPPKTGLLNMANWPAYIDKSGGRSPTLDQFRDEFGVRMRYEVAINDNEEFFGTDLQEPLSQGASTGWDIVVLTDWMINKMIRLGYLEPLFRDAIPNFFANAGEKFKDPWYDPGNTHSVPWAAGITGIGYNRALTGRDLTSIEDLFDPAFADQGVGMFSEMRDTYSFMALRAGIDPTAVTVDDVGRFTEELISLRDRGQFEGFFGNDYLDQLGLGNLAVTMAWSGDVFALSLDNPDLKFVLPEEGAMRWTDNMCIPVGAEHAHDAHLFMDFVYRDEIATQITEWVWYESPVAAVQQMIAAHAEERDDEILRDLATDRFVFPTEDTNARTHPYKVLDAEEEEDWLDLFQTVVVG